MASGETISVLGQTFNSFPELINYLATIGVDVTALQNITDINALIEYLKTLNIEPIYTYGQYLSGFATVSAVDPASTTAVATRVITDLTVTGGAATSVTKGRLSIGTLAKGLVITNLIAALGLSVYAPAEGMATLQQLIEGLNPFTIDGENVPVYIDENGKTYLDERLIESVRQQLIATGAYDEIASSLPPSGYTTKINTPVHFKRVESGFSFSVKEYNNEGEYTRTVDHSFNEITGTSPVYFMAVKPLVYEFPHGFSGVCPCLCSLEPFHLKWTRTYPDGYVSIGEYDSTRYTYNNKTIYYINVGGAQIAKIDETDPNLSPWLVTSRDTDTHTSQSVALSEASYIALHGTQSSTEGVPGFNPRDKVFADAEKTIEELSPEWYINNYKIPAPTDDNLENKTTLLPVSITNTNGLETPTTSTDTDRDGESSDDAKDKIIEDLMTAIQGLLKDPTKPNEVITPTIEVGDSGDTPPYNPPLISGASNGLWTIYNPTLAEVQQFGGWLWSSSIIDQIMRQFNNPIEAVIGFMSLYATPITGERKTIKAGYLSSPVSAKEVTNQYITIDCGNVEVPEYYHTAIDYTRSQVSIYLPFIGIVPLDASVVTGSTLNVTYRIDVLTGTCLAQIRVIKQNSDAVMYSYTGNCAVQLPLTASTYTGLVGTTIALGGSLISAVMGNPAGIASGLLSAGRSAVQNLTGTAKSGSLSANAGALGIRIPYLILTHPTAYDAFIYNQVYGYPTNIYQRLSDLGGYVRVKDIHLDTISCTKQELQMIYDRLHEGVILT